ncbi:HAD family hydrolase [Allokutzneria albata]|uniref:HAD family hydrolase n=1 Tax=Allokutzneria albata TaxID=211114 RepID=UPI0012DD918F
MRRAAPTTLGGAESIRACLRTGRRATVVSNDPEAAARAYFAQHGLPAEVWPLVGRAFAEPERMKPNPAPLLEVLEALSLPPTAAVLVSDSLTDLQEAQAAGMRCIGYANRPEKWERLCRGRRRDRGHDGAMQRHCPSVDKPQVSAVMPPSLTSNGARRKRSVCP